MDPYTNPFSNIPIEPKKYPAQIWGYCERVWNNWKRKPTWVIGTTLGFFFFVIFMAFASSPRRFPVQTIQEIKEGSSLHSVTEQFSTQGVIKNKQFFEFFAIIFGGSRDVKAGDYLFEKRLPVFEIARRVVSGDTRLAPVSVTLFEGETRSEMADRLVSVLPNFTKGEFMNITKGKEGYLFPDTYFFKKHSTASEVANVLEQNFYQKVETLAPEFESFGKSFEDVVIMASIVERESADGFSEKQMIAGILWNRMKKGMRLQVDAPFKMINGKGSSQLTSEDLGSDDPYNTYTHDGLPPGPISNPSLDAIKATITPAKTDYLFYLHDKNGQIYYAKTNNGHAENKRLYLN